MSCALRVVEALNAGETPDERIIPFIAALLRPIFNPGHHGAHVVHASRLGGSGT